MVSLTVRLPEQTKKDLLEIMKVNGLSQSKAIRYCIEQIVYSLKKKGKKKNES